MSIIHTQPETILFVLPHSLFIRNFYVRFTYTNMGEVTAERKFRFHDAQHRVCHKIMFTLSEFTRT